MNRYDFGKLIIGAGASLGFAATAFGPLGGGHRYVDSLELRAKAALKERSIEMIRVDVVRHPHLRRDIILSGHAEPDVRRSALEVVRAVPGAASVTWRDEPKEPSGPVPNAAVQL